MSDATHTVYVTVVNTEPLYREFQRIVATAWWDDRDSTWNDVPKAAQQLKALVSGIDTSADEFAGFREINIDHDVDWEELIVDELRQENADAGRDREAGL